MTTDLLPGIKTNVAAVAAMICGIAGLIFGFIDEGTSIILITSGLAFFGIGKKVERNSAKLAK